MASAAVRVSPPYEKPDASLGRSLFESVRDSHTLVIHEIQLCRDLIRSGIDADVIHIDMTLGGASIGSLTMEKLVSMCVPERGRVSIEEALPVLREVARELGAVYGLDTLAIGKRSRAVRVAELTAGAYAVIYAAKRALEMGEEIRLGLPRLCTFRHENDTVSLVSIVPSQEGMMGYARDETGIVRRVEIDEGRNPQVRGFNYLRISLSDRL